MHFARRLLLETSVLKALVRQGLKDAMKGKDKERSTVIRGIIQEFTLAEKTANGVIELTDTSAKKVLHKMVDTLKTVSEEYVAADRKDLADKIDFELSVVSSYLPPPIPKEELAKMVEECIGSVNATSMRDISKIFACLAAKLGEDNLPPRNHIVPLIQALLTPPKA